MLLKEAGIKPPYVLVGHSFAAFGVRSYAARYPNEGAGIVLLDPLHPAEWLNTTTGSRPISRHPKLIGV